MTNKQQEKTMNDEQQQEKTYCKHCGSRTDIDRGEHLAPVLSKHFCSKPCLARYYADKGGVYHEQKCGFRVQKFGCTYTVQTFQGKDGTHTWEIDVDGDELIFIDEMFIEALMSTMIMECPACGEEND